MIKLFRKFDPRLAAELKKERRPIFFGLLCAGLASSLGSLNIPLVKFSGEAIEKQHPERLYWISLFVIALFAIKYSFTRGQIYFLSLAANKLASDLRVRLFRKLLHLPVSYFNEKRSGAIQSVLTNDVNVYQSAVGMIRDSIDGPIKAVVAFFWVFYIQWQLGLVSMLFMPILAILIQQNSKRVRRAQRQVQDDLSDLSAVTQEALQGTRIVKAFSAEERVELRFSALIQKSLNSQMAAVRRIATLRPMVELIGAVTLAAVLSICAFLAKTGGLAVSDIVALAFALDVINQGAKNLGSVHNTYAQVQAASDRIYGEILDIPEQSQHEEGLRKLDQVKGKLEFQGVSFTYPDGTRAVSNVSFSIEPGTSLALVGPSGAGKSTIADLVLRFYDPTEGQILFDGVDVRELKASWLRNQIGVVPQQTFLFAGSIAENIRLGAPEASEEDLRQAAKTAHADVFVDAIPEQYETALGERGIRLSGGEMQRIAIARAIVRKPAVLLLDEATSNLDAVSEKAVQEALEEVMKGRTTLFIAHRLTTAARADKVLVLSHGEVVEYGSHEQLMSNGGVYAGMFKAFSRGVIDESLG